MKPKLILIVGMPRSGTTITELLLSSHHELLGIGEHIHLVDYHLPRGNNTALEGKKECSCGSIASECRLWSKYFLWLHDDNGILSRKGIQYKKVFDFAKDEYSACKGLIDSSPGGLEMFDELKKDFEIFAVHISRDIASWYFSQRGRNPLINLKKLIQWIFTNLKIAFFLRKNSIDHIRVGYEEIIDDSEFLLTLIFKRLKIEPSNNCLSKYLARPSNIHALYGNRTRTTFSKGVSLTYSLKWVINSDALMWIIIGLLRPINKIFVYSNMAEKRK